MPTSETDGRAAVDPLDEYARALVDARRSRMRLAPRRPALTSADAYAVQARFAKRWTRATRVTAAGYKVSLTSAETQRSVAATEPTFGVLFGNCVLREPARVALDDLFCPLLEPELVFVMTRAVGDDPTEEEVVDCARVAAGLEIPDSCYAGWFGEVELDVADVIADNSLAGLLVVGEPVPASDVDLGALTASLSRDGETIATGAAAAVEGGPAAMVAWLARALARQGRRLEPGAVVSSGTFTVPQLAGKGRYEAVFPGVGRVSATLE